MLNKLDKKQRKALEALSDIQLMEALDVEETKLKGLKKKLAKVEGFPERGVETWFRLASKNLYTRRHNRFLVVMNLILIFPLL